MPDEINPKGPALLLRTGQVITGSFKDIGEDDWYCLIREDGRHVKVLAAEVVAVWLQPKPPSNRNPGTASGSN